MKPKHLLFPLTLSLLTACQPKAEVGMEIPEANIRELIANPSTLSLNEEIKQVEYIPLRTTEDDQSLIDGVAGFAVTSKHIYVYPVKEQRIALFNRQGDFIRTLITFGQGPGEFNDMLSDIQANEERNRLYLFGMSGIWPEFLFPQWKSTDSADGSLWYREVKEQSISVRLSARSK